MGQKVNPHGFRVGVIQDWNTTWFAGKKDFGKFLVEDYKLREYIKKTHYASGISKITIERAQGKVVINIYTSRPGIIIGAKGAGIDALKKQLAKIAAPKTAMSLNVHEVKRPDMEAVLVAESIAVMLEKRSSFRRTM